MPGPCPGPRIDDDERPLAVVDHDSLGRHDANQPIVDRPLQGAAVTDELRLEIEDMRGGSAVCSRY